MPRLRSVFQRKSRVALLNRSALGDLILCVPALYAAKAINDELEFTLFCDEKNVQLARLIPVFNKVCRIPNLGNTYISLIVGGVYARFRRYDIFVSLKVGVGRQGGLFAKIAKCDYSTGFVAPSDRSWQEAKQYSSDRAFTHSLTLTEDEYRNRPYAETISRLFFNDIFEINSYKLVPSDLALIRPLVGRDAEFLRRRVIVISVGSALDPRKPSVSYIMSLVDRLLLETDLFIALSGLSDDLRCYRSSFNDLDDRLVLAETPTIGELVGLLSQAEVAVGGDGGTMHLSSFLGKKTIVLMPNKNAKKWTPIGPSVELLQYETRADDVSLDAVLSRVRFFLYESKRQTFSKGRLR